MQFERSTPASASLARPTVFWTAFGVGVQVVNACIFKSVSTGITGTVSALAISDNSPEYVITNNVFYDFDGANDEVINGASSTPDVKLYNNTFINNTTAILSRSTYLCKNNIFQDCAADITGTLNASNDYNLTDNGSIAGANSVASSTLTFENKAADNFALVVGDTSAIGAGIGPSSDTNVPLSDIIGTARSGATTDIGAFVFVGGGGGSTLTADSGTYLYTGTDAQLLATRILKADTGAYLHTGSTVSLLKGFILTAQSGSYSYLGQDATLTYTPAGAFILTADSGNYTYTGSNINFNRDRVIIASSGTYNYSGTDIQIILPGQIWTDKPSASTNWNNQTVTTTIWTDK